MNKLNVEYQKVKELIPYDLNAKQHDGKQVEDIAKSIQKYGFRQPIVVDKDGVIIIGHGRLMAAKKLGLEEVPVVKADDLTDEEVKELRIVDNKVAESPWDLDMLKLDVSDLNFDDFNFEFDFPEELAGDEKEAVEDEYDEPLPEEPVSKPGQIWKLGRHRLMCGDSTSVVDVRKLVGDVKIDLLITDPPYNVDYEGGTGMKIMNDSMEDDKFRMFLKDAFSSANEVMKPGAVFYIWHADSEGYNFRGACQDVGWKVRECLIWNKNSLVMGRMDYHYKHEPCIYGWKEGAGHLWASDRKQTTVIEWDKPKKNDIHPTMKPVGLFDYQIKNNTKGGDAVLDLFNGSGTTIMACEQNGRNAFCMELDPKYVDAAIGRWEQFTGEKAELVSE